VSPVFVLAAAALPPGPEGRAQAAPPPKRFAPRALRRVTRLTRLCLPLAEAVLVQAGHAGDSTLGLVAGTGLADLEQTAGFLAGLHARGERYASPQMFQRSVHGALAGELAILFGLQGFNLTVTQGRLSGEAALFQGALAIAAGRCERCLVVAADGVSEALLSAHEALGGKVAEGAAAVLLGRDGPGLARLDAVDLPRCVPGTYGAHGLVQLALAVETGEASRVPAGVHLSQGS
jgi:hypothetical protein